MLHVDPDKIIVTVGGVLTFPKTATQAEVDKEIDRQLAAFRPFILDTLAKKGWKP